jgi:hypothetical protein
LLRARRTAARPTWFILALRHRWFRSSTPSHAAALHATGSLLELLVAALPGGVVPIQL